MMMERSKPDPCDASLAALLDAVGRTADEELVCDELLEFIACYLERGHTLPPDIHTRIQHHLSICPECSEEFEALRTSTVDPSADPST